ncbi:MAG: LysM peptidoglycan-binding domain-containing protein [Bacilli bacterium]
MFETYVVREGDTIESIARFYGIDSEEIIKVNNLERIYYLMPGQQLKIPLTPPPGFEYYTIQPGDSLYSIGQKYNTNPETLAAINGLDIEAYIYPGEKIIAPKGGVRTYVVKEGETIKDVAERLGVDQTQLLMDNEGIYLVPGQLILHQEK